MWGVIVVNPPSLTLVKLDFATITVEIKQQAGLWRRYECAKYDQDGCGIDSTNLFKGHARGGGGLGGIAC